MISFDATSGQTAVNGTAASPNTNTWTHTPLGTPAAVTVNIGWTQNLGDMGNTTISGVTYGGATMTLAGSVTAGGYSLVKYTLASPSAGAQTVAVTWQNDDGATRGMGSGCSNSYTSGGTASFGALDTATGATSPATNAVAGTSTSNLMDHGYLISDGGSAAITLTINGTNETKRSGVTTTQGTGYTRAQHATSTQTSANGTVTANATESANRSWAISSIEIKEILSSLKGSTLPMMGMA